MSTESFNRAMAATALAVSVAAVGVAIVSWDMVSTLHAESNAPITVARLHADSRLAARRSTTCATPASERNDAVPRSSLALLPGNGAERAPEAVEGAAALPSQAHRHGSEPARAELHPCPRDTSGADPVEVLRRRLDHVESALADLRTMLERPDGAASVSSNGSEAIGFATADDAERILDRLEMAVSRLRAGVDDVGAEMARHGRWSEAAFRMVEFQAAPNPIDDTAVTTVIEH